MNFHLTFPIKPFEQKINYQQKMLFVGSCFADNIGDLLLKYKFNSLINPHGILYNPFSISTAINRYIDNKSLKEDELFFANDLWNSWEHHSKFSNENKEEGLKLINEKIAEAHTQLKDADWLFITLGSAFVYKHIDNNSIVGNCHKIPQKQFEKILINSDEIIKEYKELFIKLKKNNSKIKIVFTVSPVRYIRDGVIENNHSKAQLLSAVHQLEKEFENVFYFSAYELVIDDLRDYRFYKADLVHPNDLAIEYVFDKLKETMFDIRTIEIYEKVKSLIAGINHRPFNENSESHKKFKSSLFKICKDLESIIPSADFSAELKFLS